MEETSGKVPMTNCSNCNEEEFGIVQDQSIIICLDCGKCTGDRQGDRLDVHEKRIKRVKLLLNELREFNLNIRTDDELARIERILELIELEMGYYHQWVGEKADVIQMRGNKGKRQWRSDTRTYTIGDYRTTYD